MSQELFTGIVMDSTKHVIKGAQVSLKSKNFNLTTMITVSKGGHSAFKT